MSEPSPQQNNAIPDTPGPPREVRSWLGSIIESSDDAIVSKTLDGIVTTWNAAAERIFGYTAADMVGKPITTMIPEDRQKEEPMILERLRRGERVDHFETVRRRKDGTMVEVSVTISPIRDGKGVIIGASKIARDITFQKHVQRELQEAKDSAEAANQAKDHFLSVLSHELRTPLTPALGAISLIESSAELSPPLREQVSMIRRNVETEARLVDDLLDLTRIARGKLRLHFEVIDAHAVIRNVMSMFQNEIDEKALAVTVALRAKEYHIWADPGRFQQVLLNLMSNAVKFTPQDGLITLRSSNLAAAAGNEPGAAPLKIEVIDSGVGIESHVLPRLFNAFEQGEQATNRRFGGLGLGLSIVKALMEMHGGSVVAHSAGRDQGTAVAITVPTVVPVPEQSASAASVSRRAKGYRILLVEDHADTRLVMTLLLRSFGCVVTTAATVREAMDLAERETFDLLVSDIWLPDGTGLNVVRHIKQRQPLKAIAISGFGQEEDLRRSREAGFSLHLIKPVNINTLRNAIH